ncbi:CDP-diacylglycerol--serine O-phosphatidyltransferase [Haliea sp. E1-2-M8]|uniref:CDP-diacylglycerol--serine O-phosphatidyltransferase n=1 Tax=Haliea sp. E1-2-M8 TaxID=3064706 RepID=UPI0027236128|nr:CDP-diacylglycerol--serine O-phosphatidyltransferase [Haliea sp. E1-2-M8]MDO8864125.1 CDP-diacylglycerol--serine O-phosphatidyltransferase [Haliea sp. E1-2-M8]
MSDARDDKTREAGQGSQADLQGVAQPLELIVDEHEEEFSENGRTVRRKGVFLLPNLLTTGALFAGFYAVVAAMRGDFESAPVAIFAAMVLDGLDGRIARMTNTSSKFGAEYDSLADMVSFGVAPALVMFSWALGELGKFGWSAAFIYVACAALRLARFNTQIDTADTNFFTGLASPAAAAIIASTVWVCHDLGWVGEQLPHVVAILVAVLTAVTGLLMIANFPYYSFKTVDFRGRVPFVAMIVLVLVFSLVTLNPPSMFLLAFLAYAVSGPIMQLQRWRQEKRAAL